MDEKLEQMKADLERQIVVLSRQMAHAIGDFDVALECVAREVDARLKDMDSRVAKLESGRGV